MARNQVAQIICKQQLKRSRVLLSAQRQPIFLQEKIQTLASTQILLKYLRCVKR